MIAKALTVLVFAFLASVAYTTPVDERKPLDCPQNEKYYYCSLEVCEKTCKDLVTSIPCPLIDANCYRPSCECVEGYVRGQDGICIPHAKCHCPPNEKYYHCSLEVCYKTCKHIVKPPPCPQIHASCYLPSCECVPGYLRGLDDICIPRDKCPKE